MGALKIVLIPVMIVTLIAGSYFTIVDGIKDAVTMKIGEIQEILEDTSGAIKESFRKTSNWIEDKLNIGTYKLPNGAQTLFFEISKEKFEKIKVAIDDIINIEEGGYDDILIKKMLLTYYSSICTRDTQILIYITQDEYDQFDNSEGTFEKVKGNEIGGSSKDLYLSTYGIIELYKDGKIDKDSQMVYLPLEDLEIVKKDAVEKNMKNAVEALSRCYTINDIGKIQMYKITTTSGNSDTDYAEGKEKDELEDKETNSAELVELDYAQYVSPYVIPVEFLADLLNITGSPDFIDKFSALQYDSYVRLGIYETSLIKTTTTTKEYNLNTTIEGVRNNPSITGGSANLSDLQKVYPENSVWQENYSKWYGYQCWAFVQWATESYYGNRADTATYLNSAGNGWTKNKNKSAVDSIKAGDTIRYHRSATNIVGHSAWVIAVNGNTLTLAEANWSGGNIVTWTRTVTKEQVKNDHFDYVIVAPYAIGSNEDPHNKEQEADTTTENETSQEETSTEEDRVKYNEIQPTVITKTENEVIRNYQMEIVELDTWYVNIKQENVSEVTTTYQTWNENQELIDVEKVEDTIKVEKPNIGPVSHDISSLKGINKAIVDRLIKNSKENDVTWETETSILQDITESKLSTTTASTLSKGIPEIEDNTNKFLALLKNRSGEYNREDVKNGAYAPNGKVISYADIYKGKAYVGDLLENGADILFELLEDNLIGDEEGSSNTQGLVDVMKYIMWRYTGIDYGITDFSLIDIMHSDLNMVGADITVKVDGESEMVLTKEKILETIDAMDYPAQAKTNMKGAIEGLMKIQNDYKVNAVFALAVTMVESTGGTNWDAIDSSTYNWCSVKNGKGGWCTYSSFTDAIEKFGDLIANGSYYFKAGKTTVKQIAPTYCNEKWGEDVIGIMTEFYAKAGVSVKMFSGGDFLNVAKRCHDYLRENEYFYSYGDNKNAKAYVTDGPADKHGGIVADYIPKPNDIDGCKIVDCSSYVSWVLYEYGYTEFAGAQKTSTYFYNQEYPSSYEWQKVESKNAQAGDILVNSGHVEIYAGNNKSYSCGSTKSIRAIISDCNPSSFSFAIRVQNK